MDCRICAHQNFNLIQSVNDMRYQTSPKFFKVLKCHQCGVFITCDDGDVVDPSHFYSSDYGAFRKKAAGKSKIAKKPSLIKNKLKFLLRKFHIADSRLSWVQTLDIGPETRLLDIGCGVGKIGGYLKDTFSCHVIGIEPNQSAAHLAREKGFEVHTGVLEDFSFQEKFDLVLLIHVLEHIPDPLTALRHIRQLLKPTGKLVIALPNANSFERKLFQKNWDGWDIPRHVHHFNVDSLQYILQKAEFEPEKVSYEWYSLFSRSLANKLYPNLAYHQRKQKCKSVFFEQLWGLSQAVLRSSSAIQVVASPI